MTAADTMIAVREADLAAGSDAARIEAWLAARPDGTPFHRPLWLDAVAAGTGQAAHGLIAQDRFGQLLGWLPLTLVHSALFGRAMVSSGFAVDGGIVADRPAVIARLADAAWDLAQRWSAPTLELRGGPVPDGPWIARRDSHCGFVRALAADAEAELIAIPRKQRAEVRKGLDAGLDVRIGTGPDDRADHYAVYAQSVRNLGTPVFPRALFDAVLDRFGGDADILTVSKDGVPVASVLSLYHQGAVMPYWGGGTSVARALRANDMMYYALMNHARKRGMIRFDFGRSKVGTGAFAFKKNWGFDPVPLSYAVRTEDGTAPRDVNPLSPRYQARIAAWKRLPLPIANAVGPWIARGLG